MIKKSLIIQSLIALVILSGCDQCSVKSNKHQKEEKTADTTADSTTASKPTKIPKTKAEKEAIMKTCSEIQDETTCNSNTDCKFYIVCMSADKVLEIENDKELQEKLKKAGEEANIQIYTDLSEQKLGRKLKTGGIGRISEYTYEWKYLDLLKKEKINPLIGNTNWYPVAKAKDQILIDLKKAMRENDKKDIEEQEERERLEEERIAQKNLTAQKQKDLEKQEKERLEKLEREKKEREQAERNRKNEEERQKKIKEQKEIELKEQQEREKQRKIADDIKKFIEKDIFNEYTNDLSLNTNINLLNDEQKQQLIEKVKQLKSRNDIEAFSKNLFVKITASEYSLKLFEALVNNEEFKKIYKEKSYMLSINNSVKTSINKMINIPSTFNSYAKQLMTAILKNPLFNDLDIEYGNDYYTLSYSKLLEIMNTDEDKKYIYDYLQKTVSEKTIKRVLYDIIAKNQKNIFSNLNFIFKNDFVKNNFKDFSHQIKEVLSSLFTSSYEQKDKLDIINLIISNYQEGDLFIGYSTEGSFISTFRLKHVIAATQKDNEKIINYIKNKSSKEEKNMLIELANTKYFPYGFNSGDQNKIKNLLTASGILQ